MNASDAAQMLLSAAARMQCRYEISVVVPFADDEDTIGAAIQRLADHLRPLDLPFEILAVDEDSGDNSHAVLALLRAQVPELRVIQSPGRGRGADAGASRAQGRLLWIIDPDVAMGPLATVGPAITAILAGHVDAVVVHGHFVVANRLRALPAVTGLRGSRDARRRRLARRMAALGLRLDVQMIGPSPTARPRLFGLLAPRRPTTTTTRAS
ncbi:MAG TPA: glycosyltransferase [Kofleriaceae bacterium]|nr:glycosyltransferase [Kofleriaceae bacterium]